jgi:hypothetical protein
VTASEHGTTDVSALYRLHAQLKILVPTVTAPRAQSCPTRPPGLHALKEGLQVESLRDS